VPQIRHSILSYNNGAADAMAQMFLWGISMTRWLLALAILMGSLAVFAPGMTGPARADADDGGQAETQDAQPSPELRFVEIDVLAERPTAQACFTFSLPLARSPSIALENYVTVVPEIPLAATVRDDTLCLEGFAHGQDYTVTLLAGLPALGTALARPETHAFTVDDMRPSLAFADSGLILPRLGNEGLPLRTVNLDKVHVEIARIHDRNLIAEIRSGNFNATWDYRTASIVADDEGEWVWQGELLVDGPRNEPVVTALPIDETIGALRPGLYLASATAPEGDALRDDEGVERRPVNQWFVVSDLGLTSFLGEDGALIQVRSLRDARPLAGIEVALVSRNNKELTRAASDADGFVRFDPGLVRGRGGNQAAALYAYGADGEFSFIGLEGPALDLSAQDVGGRPVPGPLDAFIFTERGIYRPGETAHVTLLLRDDAARAVEDLPLIVKVLRPDGVETARHVLADQGGGSFALDIPLPRAAHSGEGSVSAHASAEAEAIGRAYFEVQDFVPPRIEFDLSSVAPRAEPGVAVPVEVAARYLYGAPAADLAGELAVVLRPADTLYPDYADYRFGLEQDADTSAVQLDPTGFSTGEDGRAGTSFVLDALPATTLPLEASVQVAMFDVGGRAVRREITLPVVSRKLSIGILPRFAGAYVAEDAVAGFDVVALDALGAPIDRPGLGWELVKVFSEWSYYTDVNGRGYWQRIERDSPAVAGGVIDATAAAPVAIAQQVGWGAYRLEIFDSETGAASSIRFHAGWGGEAADDDGAPDAIGLSFDRPLYAPGDVARVFVKPPFDSDVVVAVVDRGTDIVTRQHIAADGAEIEIPVPAEAIAGLYVVATGFTGSEPGRSELLRRAIGAAWLTVDPAGHSLAVDIAAPEKLLPDQSIEIPVTVTGAAAGEAVFLTLAAVDDGVLQLTGFAAPDPLDYYLGKQRLGVDIRDVYGDLIDPSGARPGTVRSGGDGEAAARQLANLPKRTTETVSLFSGIVTVGADGRARVPLALPDFNGRLRLMAVAWSPTRVGSAERTVVVRAPLVAELGLPVFLAPGDAADLVLSLHNLHGPAGDYDVALTAEGAVALDDNSVDAIEVALTAGAQQRMPAVLRAQEPGDGRLRLEVTGPDGARLSREWQIAVRPENPVEVKRLSAVLAPGQSLTLDWNVADGLFRQTAQVNLTVRSVPDVDVAGLVGALARDPYGFTQNAVSRAVALLYFPREVAAAGLGDAEEQARRLAGAIPDILARQVARGAFAPSWLYWDDRQEEWLGAYALDFLTRAREAGVQVPDLAYRRGLRWLTRYVSQDPSDDHGLAVQAYAYYVLARANDMDAGRARRFFEAHGAALPTALAKAQIGAALARLGDLQAANSAFAMLENGKGGLVSLIAARDAGSPYDYRSPLRERAAVAALMAESGVVAPGEITSLAAAVAKDVAATPRLSAQEMAWLLYLAQALSAFDEPVALSVDGVAVTSEAATAEPYFARFSGHEAAGAALAALRNDGDGPAYVSVSAVGNPTGALPAEENGFTIERRIVDRFGNPVDLAAVRQNDLLVVIIEGENANPDGGQTTVVDMLPAGFEIQSAQLLGGQEGEGDFPWLGELSQVLRTEAREDRFVAVTDLAPFYWQYHGAFRMAYLVRAVTPGDYVLPGVLVEDMFRPAVFARGETTRLRIVAE
jgi:uncharacterized protein YfaS (alpha-2-macroglobulin family)